VIGAEKEKGAMSTDARYRRKKGAASHLSGFSFGIERGTGKRRARGEMFARSQEMSN